MAPIHQDPYCALCDGTRDPSATCRHKKRAACRYHQTSSCRRGSSCPFVHEDIPGQTQTPATSHPRYQGGHIYPYHPPGPTPVYRPPDSQAYPVFLWQPYPPVSPSFDPRYGFARQGETVADYPDDKSDPSSAESSSTVASMDHRLRMAHDPAWMAQVESRDVQDTASSSGDVTVDSPPGYAAYGHPVFPGVRAKHAVGGRRATSGQFQGSTVAVPSPLLLSWQDGFCKKPLAYKTKPCKFYAANGKCTSGEKCTFIHGPESSASAENSRQKSAPPSNAKLPPKPLNRYDEYRARDFYPITWRVIGGGVMMGGQRQVCPAFSAGHCKLGDDCKFAHETELETDQVGFVEPKSGPADKDDRSPRQVNKNARRVRSSSQRPKSSKVPSQEPGEQRVPFLSTTPRPERTDGVVEGTQAGRKKNDQEARDAPKPLVRRRTRSMSMVHTPPSSLDVAQSNHAAEL